MGVTMNMGVTVNIWSDWTFGVTDCELLGWTANIEVTLNTGVTLDTGVNVDMLVKSV